ncbi:MAG TPA: glycosyltransferase family 9 protein [Candidatus Obscuribacterales bacterium]
MVAFIAPISFGLGDLVVSLPAIQGLIESHGGVVLVTRAAVQEELAARIPNLTGTVAESALEAAGPVAGDAYYNLREHPLQRDYWWGSPEFERDYPGYRINDILEHICRDLRVPADFGNPRPLRWYRRPDFFQKVIFIPGSDGPYKCWPTENWIALYNELRLLGYSCALLGQPECSREVGLLVEAGLPWLPTPRLVEALDAVSSSAAVVGVDTGLSHLAVQQGVPTIVLYTRLSLFVRPYPHSFPLFAPGCDPACKERFLRGAHNAVTRLPGPAQPAWSCCLPAGSSCMSKIPVEQVLEIMLAPDFQKRMSVGGVRNGKRGAAVFDA